MIQLTRISKIPLEKISKNESKKSCGKTIEHETDLKMMPQYPALSWVNVKASAKKAMYDFKKDFGEIKSATYVAEQYKQAKHSGAPEEVLDSLSETRKEYSKKVKEMRKNVYSVRYDSFDDYIKSLKSYVKENGSYMNCNECADLMLYKLRKQGVKATNVCIFTVNKNGERTSGTEHVFTVAGLRDNADIKNPDTWGNNAIICDAWAGICEKADEGIKFYKDFFAPDKGRNCFGFEYCNRNYGIND